MCAVNRPTDMGAIKFLKGRQAGKTYQITKPITALGRDPTRNDIVIDELTVSREHAELVCNNGFWSIKNVSAQNYIKVNQRHVAAKQQEIVQIKDTISLGPDVILQVCTPFQDDSISSTQRAPMPSLEISTNTNKVPQKYPLEKDVINIGRDENCDIPIEESIVSTLHFQIVRENDQFIIVHPHPARKETTNGLLYQGRQIHGHEFFRHTLTRGDVFRIGNDAGTLVTVTYDDGSGAPQDIPPEIQPIQLGASEITIGRLPDNGVVLNHPQVSAHHARLEQVAGGYRIIDLNSTNHIYVNAQRVTNHLLNLNDEVRIGPFKLIYTGSQLTQYDESKGFRIDALHLKKIGNKQTILLNDISLVIPPRKFVALVGGSGAGKSTLLDALNGLRPAQEGMVLYNGQNYYQSFSSFSSLIGYVPQDDIVHRDLTVERALYYAARMRLPEDYTESQIKQRINEVLDAVDIAHRRKLLVSKLSGGQRKRLSIALELLAKPSVFFLDEPTSGLDPGLDRKMMSLLRKLADQGNTIVLVTHATNNISSCD